MEVVRVGQWVLPEPLRMDNGVVLNTLRVGHNGINDIFVTESGLVFVIGAPTSKISLIHGRSWGWVTEEEDKKLREEFYPPADEEDGDEDILEMFELDDDDDEVVEEGPLVITAEEILAEVSKMEDEKAQVVGLARNLGFKELENGKFKCLDCDKECVNVTGISAHRRFKHPTTV